MSEKKSMRITGSVKGILFSVENGVAETDIQSDKADHTLQEELPKTDFLPQTSKTILIAEDDEFNYLLMESLLIRKGYNILRALNGREAIHLHLSEPEICLILMDLQMPEMDGFTATQKIREEDKDVPIIAQTAFVVPGIKEKAIGSGCDAFLTKPIDPEALLTQINCLLDNSREKITE
jgi:CheY-like chemotaxis protein